MDKQINVALIGAGNIGALKDDILDSPKTDAPLTHAHAIYKDYRFSLDFFIDKDPVKANKAATKWSKEIKSKSAIHISSLSNQDKYDVAVVSTNTKNHFESMMEIFRLRYLPELIVVEKPFCWDSKQAHIIQKFLIDNEIKCVVNYNRRYSNSYRNFYKNYLKNENVQQVVVRYNRGLKHDGCHALDIMNWWFGRCKNISLNKSIEPILDYPEGGRTYSLSMKYEYCPSVIFIPMDFNKCGIFEMDIFTDKNRHILANYGEYIINMDITENKTFGQKNSFNWNLKYYANDTEKIDCHSAIQTDLHYTLTNLYNKVYECLKSPKQVEDICTVEDALRVHNIIEYVDLLYNKQTR